MAIKDNIKQRRLELNLTLEEVAQIVGVTRATVQKYESGVVSNIPANKIEALSRALQTTPAYLMGWEKSTQRPTRGISIPVLGSVAAGVPIEAIEDIIDYEDITPELARTGDFFALSIKGDSMEPRIKEGDVVIVRKQNTCDTGDVAIVLVNGDEATVKRIRKSENGIMLIPNNPIYEPVFYSREDIETLPVTIIGKVVELRGKF